MTTSHTARGSASRWGPLFGSRVNDWAQTWEGPSGWGTPVYQYVLDRCAIGAGSRLLDCGCGAGRFARMAADCGVKVAGIDAAKELIEIAAERTPDGDFRVGDLEELPWPDRSFDWVTGFSSFQFADDKVRALIEARRVSRGSVVVVIPSRVPESGITSVFKPLFPLFPPQALESMRQSGMFALSDPGKVEEVIAAAGLELESDQEIACPIGFESADAAVRAFVGAGPTAAAVRHSGESEVARAVREALHPCTTDDGRVALPGWYRVVQTRP